MNKKTQKHLGLQIKDFISINTDKCPVHEVDINISSPIILNIYNKIRWIIPPTFLRKWCNPSSQQLNINGRVMLQVVSSESSDFNN